MPEELLPKPELDLPLPEKDLPLPRPQMPEQSDGGQAEKELPAGNTNATPKPDLATQGQAIGAQTESIPQGQILKAEPKPNAEPEEKHSGMKKLFLSSFIFGVIFVIILILIGVGVILSKENSKPQNTQVVKTQVKPPSPTPDPTADWKTYKSSYDFFMLKYPPFLEILEDKYNAKAFRTFVQNDEVQLVIHPGGLSGETNLDSYQANLETLGANNFSPYQISNEEALKYKIITKGEESIEVITIYNGKVYKITYTYKDPDQIQYLDQILSTFKFTGSTSPTPSTSAENYCPNSKGMSYNEALEIASSSICAEQGTILNTKQCNPSGTGYWWLDFTPSTPKSGCNPACVVDIAAKKAEINWRCTGLVIPQN